MLPGRLVTAIYQQLMAELHRWLSSKVRVSTWRSSSSRPLWS